MYGVNEDAYWDSYQVTHDPQWPDVEDDFTEWDQADMDADEMILERHVV